MFYRNFGGPLKLNLPLNIVRKKFCENDGNNVMESTICDKQKNKMYIQKYMYYLYIYKFTNCRGIIMTYTGQTNNLERRMKEHRKKSKHRLVLMHLEIYNTRKEVCKRESEFKHWSKIKKEYNEKNCIWRRKLRYEHLYDHIIDRILQKYC